MAAMSLSNSDAGKHGSLTLHEENYFCIRQDLVISMFDIRFLFNFESKVGRIGAIVCSTKRKRDFFKTIKDILFNNSRNFPSPVDINKQCPLLRPVWSIYY